MVKKEYRRQNIFKQEKDLERMKKNYMEKHFNGDPNSYYKKFIQRFNAYHSSSQRIREECAQKVRTLFAGGECE